MEPIKQHLIDPELCIRCHTCEQACPIDAITHDDNNVVVDASKCNFCMDCIAPCPTGSIDNWRLVSKTYTLEEQLGWDELPEQEKFESTSAGREANIEAFDEDIANLLLQAHQGTGGRAHAPASASKPTVNLYKSDNPVEAIVQGNFKLTGDTSDADIRHIILDFGPKRFPILEGQTIGIIPPGVTSENKPHLPRLYSVSSPRDGERPNTNNISLTVKREEDGICSNYICDLKIGDKVKITGPFGSTFLMPNDPQANIIMICTGTGSAPFRAMTMRRLRTYSHVDHPMTLFFGARSPEALPYFGPLKKVSDNLLDKHFAFSRIESQEKIYVQDLIKKEHGKLAKMLTRDSTYIYICGLKSMENGVEEALEYVADKTDMNWNDIKQAMRKDGRYHVETY